MNTYLIASDSYKKLDNEVKKITSDSLNVIKYDLRENTIDDVINEAGYFSLLNEMKYIVVVVDNLFKATKKDESKSDDDYKKLENYLNNPNPLCTIIFKSLGLPDKRKKIFKKINEVGKVVILPALNKKELTYECMNILKSKKYSVDYETASFIVDNSYVNYDIMTNELDKIFTLLKPCNITKDNISNIISLSVSNNTFVYINAIIHRDIENASNQIKMLETLKIDPAVVIVMLAKEYQMMYLLKKNSPRDVQNLFHKEDWQMNNYLLNSQSYSEKELEKIIIKLNDYDYKYKSGLLDKSIILNLITLDLCE